MAGDGERMAFAVALALTLALALPPVIRAFISDNDTLLIPLLDNEPDLGDDSNAILSAAAAPALFDEDDAEEENEDFGTSTTQPPFAVVTEAETSDMDVEGMGPGEWMGRGMGMVPGAWTMQPLNHEDLQKLHPAPTFTYEHHPSAPFPPSIFPSRRPFRPPPAPYLHQSARYGPYFEDGEGPANVTARVGSNVRLDCRVGLLHDKTVTWLHRKADYIHLLTVGKVEYSSDQRIRLSFRYPNNWRLEVVYVTRRDEGLYECQVATHPPRVRQIFLKVTGTPEVTVVDENGHEVTERYYKAGSAMELTCIASQLEETQEPLVWRHGDNVLDHGVSANSTVVAGSLVSTLSVERAYKSHSGNYSCSVGAGLVTATVAIHVLNGELPAAVQHGNGVDGAGACDEGAAWACWVMAALVVVTSAALYSGPSLPSR